MNVIGKIVISIDLSNETKELIKELFELIEKEEQETKEAIVREKIKCLRDQMNEIDFKSKSDYISSNCLNKALSTRWDGE